MHKHLRLILALAALPPAGRATPVSITGTTTYFQNFDGLGTGSPVWTNDSTIPGWYAQINNGNTATGNVQAANGVTVLSGLLNLGSPGAADRALGSKATGTGNMANIAYGVLFQNTGTKPVALSQVNYIGELWRTNSGTGTPLVAVNEEYSFFYQVSNTAITNILSGTGAPTAAAGAGFAALTGAEWMSPVNTPLETQLDGNLDANRQSVSVTPSGINLLPGQFLMLKWTDANEAGTDGFQGIDNVSIQFTELNGVLTPSAVAMTRSDSGTPGTPADDTFGFTVNVAASGSGVGPGWTTTDANPPATNPSSGAYGANVVWSGFPVSSPKTVTFMDNPTTAITASITVQVPRIIGVNELAGGAPVITNGASATGWTHDESALTMTQNNATQADHVINSEVIDLTSIGAVKFSAELDAIAGASSGFEAGDSFALQLIIDGGAPVSVLGAADADGNGRLTGTTELPATASITTSFSFAHLIPASANTLQIRITGNSNSAAETFLVRNLKLGVAPPSIAVAGAGPVMVNHQGTVVAADDTFSGPVSVTPINLGGSTGWTSNNPPPASGLYASPNPVTFGPYPVSSGARAVTLSDGANPSVTAAFTLTPPAPVLAASAATNIVRHENGPGVADDTVSFDTVITGQNGGPRWTATGGALPVSGPYGPATITVPAGAASAVLTFTDVSYPAATQDLTVPLPARYVIGSQYYGGSARELATALDTPPAAAWTNDPVARTLDMTTGGTSDKIVVSDVIDLTAVGSVDFSAVLLARETSTGSNFETTDRFKAELVIDVGTAGEQIVNLVTAWDSGDGTSNVPPAPNGPPNGYINGYQGTVTTAPLDTTLLEYNDQKARDEFNPGGANGDAQIENMFPLSYAIPASANSVQLRIYGAGISGSEFFTVSNILFTSVQPTRDSDSDGITDLQELNDGTDPHNPASVFGITSVTPQPGNPGTVLAAFPTVSGRIYRGYYSSNLAAWTRDDSHPLVTGDGSSQSWPLVPQPAPGTRRYLRVLVGRTASDFPATLP